MMFTDHELFLAADALCAGFFRVTRRASVGADFYIGATLGTILMIGDGIRAHFLLLQEIY